MVNDRQSLDLTTFAQAKGGGEVEWRISAGPVSYPEAVTGMESRAAEIADRKASELVWLLEHPPLYTSGTSGKEGDLLDPRFPLFTTGRGGQLTYHGPGQRVAQKGAVRAGTAGADLVGGAVVEQEAFLEPAAAQARDLALRGQGDLHVERIALAGARRDERRD